MLGAWRQELVAPSLGGAGQAQCRIKIWGPLFNVIKTFKIVTTGHLTKLGVLCVCMGCKPMTSPLVSNTGQKRRGPDSGPGGESLEKRPA